MPVVNLGEDFDMKEIESRISFRSKSSPRFTINAMKEDIKINEIQKKNQISLESWSKGHVVGMKVTFF